MSADARITADEIAGAVHDVRQMLAVITGRVGLLSRGENNPQLIKNLDAMELAATGAEQILARLLMAATGKNHATAPAGDVLVALTQSTKLILPEPNTDWQWSDDSSTGPSAKVWFVKTNISEGCLTTVPESILREVMNNLLLNSLTVMSDGGTVQAKVETCGDQWCLTLLDSGPGVPSEMVAKIFEQGFSTSEEDGRGLGLAYCRNLLAAFGASLQYVTQEEPGACFQLLLPKSDSAPKSDISPNEAEAGSGSIPTSFRPQVLIVDDELSVREMLADVFSELGCSVEVARDAPDADRIFSTNKFQMALIDQSLPGISGLDLAIGLRKQDPNLVLVLISGWGQEEILDRAYHSDVDLVAGKPITLGKIEELLNEAGDLYHHRTGGS